MALLCGWDPVAYLRHDGVERAVADAVLERAASLRAQEMQRVAEVTGSYAGSRCGEVLAQAFRGR